MLPQNSGPGGAEDGLHRPATQWVSEVKDLLVTEFSFK